MSSEWPQSVQDATHSIQNTYSESNAGENEEETPLLYSRNSACFRNTWITFFVVLFCIGFAAGTYLLLIESIERPISHASNYSLITRSRWQARKRVSDIPKLQVPVERVLLTKSDSPECAMEMDCSEKVYEVQSDHLSRLKQPDIGYNFLFAGDGQTYEGRGWKYRAMVSSSGSHDNTTVVIAFLGVFNNSLPSTKQISQAKSFLNAAENKGKLAPCYSILEESNLRQARYFLENVVLYFQEYFKSRHKHCS